MVFLVRAVIRRETRKNSLKTAYESSALPLSYSGNPEKTGYF